MGLEKPTRLPMCTLLEVVVVPLVGEPCLLPSLPYPGVGGYT